MYKRKLLTSLAIAAAMTLAACSDSNDDASPNNTSEPSTNTDGAVDDGMGGGDTSAIAGLWDGTTTEDDVEDVVYWNLSEDGVLTRYDDQQDGAAGADSQNCYIVGDPISVSPEADDAYSLFNVAVTAVKADDTLTITFTEPDKNDVNNNGDTTETPTLTWTLLTTPTVDDLNECEETTPGGEQDSDSDATETNPEDGGDGANGDEGEAPDTGDNTDDAGTDEQPTDAPTSGTGEDTPDAPDAGTDDEMPVTSVDPNDDSDIPFDTTGGRRPLMTRAECTTNGGVIIGDIGDGATQKEDYRCESGKPPVANITYLEGEPVAADGEVCCM